jgi:DNA-binding PadR family transcriptional regulator
VNEDPTSLLPLPNAAFHILLAVADEDRHGYAIIQDVEVRTSGALKLSPGTLYRSIQRPAPELDDERRRYYRITPFGRAVAEAESRRMSQLVRMARARGFVPGKA